MTGEISAAESNEIGLKKSMQGKRAVNCREGSQQVLVPPFMDDRAILTRMNLDGCSKKAAVEALRREWLEL